LKDENLGTIHGFSLRKVQQNLQKTITWTKKSSKGSAEWEAACIQVGMRPRKLTTPVKTRWTSQILMFRDCLKFRPAIEVCYGKNDERRLPEEDDWLVAAAVVEVMEEIVAACVLNQGEGLWLLSDALHSVLDVWVKLQKKSAQNSFGNLEEMKVVDRRLLMLRKAICMSTSIALKPFLEWASSFIPDKTLYMVALMLDPRYKKMGIISQFHGDRGKGAEVVREYLTQRLIPMLVSTYRDTNAHVQNDEPVEGAEGQDNTFDIFSTEVQSREDNFKEIVTSELKRFQDLSVAPKGTKVLKWWSDHQTTFPTLAQVAKQVYCIPGSQAEVERIFSLCGILTGLRRCRLGVPNLEMLVRINKNLPQDLTQLSSIANLGGSSNLRVSLMRKVTRFACLKAS